MKFNLKSRKITAILSSSAGVVQQLTQVFGGFIYRTIFLMILDKAYFGITGLFTNILQMFSLTELGIGVALVYSLHKHYANQNMDVVRGLVKFYKRVYWLIAGIVMTLGICFYPFIELVVDISEVPPEVNLGRVYFLFLAQSVVGYLFAYRHSVLAVRQQQYLTSLFSSVTLIAGYIIRTVLLVTWKNYELLLFVGIACDILMEWLFFLWIGHHNKDVLEGPSELPQSEKTEIYRNTLGMMCHKVGSIVVTSTDNIVLSKYVSLAAVGIYSNYLTLISAISGLVNRIFYAIQPTVTNYVVSNTKEDNKILFFKLLHINLWVASFTTVCLYLLLNPFIGTVWLDQSFVFSRSVVAVICLQYFIQITTTTAGTYVSSCGLFHRDKIRPLIESAVNLSVSIIFTKKIGIAGVFVGTCVSGIFTYYWRQPYLVFHNVLGSGLVRYWMTMFGWFALTVGMCLFGDWLFPYIGNTLWGFVLKLLIAVLGSNAVIIVFTFRSEGFRYLLNMLLGFLGIRKNEEA